MARTNADGKSSDNRAAMRMTRKTSLTNAEGNGHGETTKNVVVIQKSREVSGRRREPAPDTTTRQIGKVAAIRELAITLPVVRRCKIDYWDYPQE